MNPYTTIETRCDGTRYLPMQLRGAQPGELVASLRSLRLLECKVPEGQSKTSAWLVTLFFTSDVSIQLTASCTQAIGWEEFGTINVDVLSKTAAEPPCKWVSLALSEVLDIAGIELVRWQGSGLIVDAGIRLSFTDGRAFYAVAQDVPGELFLTMPGEELPSSWQLPADEYSVAPFEFLGQGRSA